MTKADSEQQFYMLDARSLPVQKTAGFSYRRYSIDIRLEERKLEGKIRKVNSLDQLNFQHEFSTCIKRYGGSTILENEEPETSELASIMEINYEIVEYLTKFIPTVDISMESSVGKEAILDDTKETNSNSVWIILYLFQILILCTIFSFPVLLIPQHDSVQLPQYWFETIILGLFTQILSWPLDTIIVIKDYLRANSFVSIQVFIKLYFVVATFWITINCFCHFVWTAAIGYHHPMPLSLILGYFVYVVHYTNLYFILCQDVSWDNDLSIRYKAFISNRLWCILIDLQYKGLSLLFNMLPNATQWILAFVLPLVREVNYKISYYLMVESPKIEDGKENTIIGMYGFHALYVAIKLGQTTTNVTSILILVVDFALNLYSCHEVIKLHRSIVPDASFASTQFKKQRDSILIKLVLTEILEILAPLSYLITVLLAYYGPNAEILGNIRNGCWHFKPIQDIGQLVFHVAIMFIIDSSSAVIVGYWLFKACSINFVEETFKVIREKWDAIAIIMANFLTYHYISLLINFGMDMTLEFQWIHRSTNTSQFSDDVRSYDCMGY